ncbi:MAG: sodium/hydrogen exchanger [Phycisphaerales bacterium]|nr:sodium/hydrogen exchanger [Phycisphaerales bacterium]MDB5358008.1 sodium/hydrogen exchanger [Phycisphaerales bacterium]
MQLFQVIAILVTVTALLGYVNHRFIRLHPSIGLMLSALVLSLALALLGRLGFGVKAVTADFLDHIAFGKALLQWMLGFLLFAGALTVDLNELWGQRVITATLSVVSTVASMFIVGILTWLALRAIHLPLPFPVCLLFGALISPTDPVAVVSLMKSVGAPKSVATVISGESLFNDGIGVVLFLTLLSYVYGDGSVTSVGVVRLFVQEALGGCLLGFITGVAVYRMLRTVRDFQIEVLLTLALVMATYALAEAMDVSGPIAVVVAGLLIGNHGRSFDMAEDVREDLLHFWELIESIMNALLFVLIGLQILVMPYSPRYFAAGALAVPIVLLARWLSVEGAVRVLALRGRSAKHMVPILTWGGLRGGLAIAMALSLPPGSQHRGLIVAITYGVVAFSIVVQGTTLQQVVRRSVTNDASELVERK